MNETDFDLPLKTLQYDKATGNLANAYTDAKRLEQAYIERYDEIAWRFRVGHMQYWLNQQLTEQAN